MDAKHEHTGGGGMTTTSAGAGDGGGSAPVKREDGSIKELIISMAIALAMALVAKVFVIEAFVIPTGSMAPTLLGQHMVFRSDQTGREWTVNPWFFANGVNYSTQSEMVRGGARPEVRVPVVTDPMTISRVTRGDYGSNGMITGRGYTPEPQPKPLRAGDRILVQKLLYEVTSPKRWDVVVFKNPQDPTVNFIKRLAGLPNEQIWIADGDVFARPIERGTERGPVATGEWRVQRKPARVQRSLWRPIFSSEYTPIDPVSASTGLRWFETPWSGEGWETGDGRSYRTESGAATVLAWDSARWPITDWEPYNDDRFRVGPRPNFPVSDVRVRADVVPDGEGMRIAAVVRARQHEFRGEIGAGRALVRMRREGGNWETIGEGPAPVVRAGRVARVEFWHVDQTVELWVDGKRVAHGEYAWTPEDRLEWVTGIGHAKDAESDTSLANPAIYVHGGAEVWWEFEGSPATLHRVGVDRDLYYQAAVFASGDSRGRPAFGTHPRNLAATGPDQFFFLGDNSPASEDSRLWPRVDDEVARQIDPTRGLVDRRMILGKAFFVYFPAPHVVQVGPIRLPVPDFGRMRWIK